MSRTFESRGPGPSYKDIYETHLDQNDQDETTKIKPLSHGTYIAHIRYIGTYQDIYGTHLDQHIHDETDPMFMPS
jgi:hypothetical protein